MRILRAPRAVGAGSTLKAPATDLARLLDEARETTRACLPWRVDVGVLLDHAQRALQQTEQGLRSFFEGSPDAMLTFDDEGRCVDANLAACELFCLGRDQLLGRPVGELTDSKFDVEAFRSDFRQTKSCRGEIPLVCADGTRTLVEFHARADVVPGLHLSVIRDISEPKTLEAKFRAVVDGGTDAIVIVDETGCIALVNRRAEELFGYRQDELLCRSIDVLVAESDRRRFQKHWQRYVADPAARLTRALRLGSVRKDGTPVAVDVNLVAVHQDVGLMVVAAMRDATEREQLEGRLRDIAKLDAIGQVATGIVHDFNNALSVILVSAGFALKAARDQKVAEDVARIITAAEHAAALAKRLLAFSREAQASRGAVCVAELVRSMHFMVRSIVREDVRVEMVLDEDVAPVSIHPSHLEQVMLNLLVNASHAMPDGGRLLIATASHHVDSSDPELARDMTPGPYTRLSVADSGVGMSQDVLDRAFEPFFTTKPPGEGTGLGLASAAYVVRNAGGSIRVRSEPGRGTTVDVYLPCTEHELQASEVATDARPFEGSETILVVEDEAAVLRSTARVLASAGYEVLEARTGSEALEVAKDRPGAIDLLLCDLIMPQMGGLELAKRFRERWPATKILFLTGYGGKPRTENTPCFSKPVTRTRLLECVRERLDES